MGEKKTVENLTMLEYVKMEGPQIWVGRKPPYGWDSVEMLNSSNYRVTSSHHHKYRVVWFCETLLDEVGQLGWRIVVDELIRLICEQGYLVIRMREMMTPSLPMLKRFLGRHIGINVSLDSEHEDKEIKVWTLVFKIERKDIQQYVAKDWTFAVLTGGKKVDNVVRFLKSIRENEPDHNSEIIIVGPQDKRYDKYNVRYIDTAQFRDEQYAEISRKKNTIIDTATRTNLMIIHDRYMLNSDFFTGFEKYGYDFDLITVSQFRESGEEYPCYATQNVNMHLSGQIWVQEYRNLYDNQFITGGLIIMKRLTAEKIKFNKLLMWNQMEDVELTQVCMERGIIPRVNYISTATVFDGALNGWMTEEMARASGAFGIVPALPQSANRGPLLFRFINSITKHIPEPLKRLKLYQFLKTKYWAGK